MVYVIKRLTILILLVATPCFAKSMTMSVPTQVSLASDSTIFHFKMNDNAANTTLTDTSGNSRNMTLSSNSSTLTTTGKINKAIDFNNTDYAYIADAAIYSFGDGSSDSPFSICAWFDFDATSSDHQVILAKYNSGSGREYWFEMNDTDQAMFWLYDESADGYIYAYSSVLSTGQYHICGTYDGSSSHTGLNMYIDGALDNDTLSFGGGTYVAMEDLGNNVTIGRAANAVWYFDSWIDDVRLFSSELTQADVDILYASGSGSENEWSTSNANVIGNSASVTTTHNLNTSADLMVEGVVEIDGVLYVDNDVTITGSFYSSSTDSHLILKSPDASCSQCGPDNSDVWSCASITCP